MCEISQRQLDANQSTIRIQFNKNKNWNSAQKAVLTAGSHTCSDKCFCHTMSSKCKNVLLESSSPFQLRNEDGPSYPAT